MQTVDTSEQLRELLEQGARGVATDLDPENYPPTPTLWPLDPEAAAVFFPAITKGSSSRFDAQAYVARRPNVTRWFDWDEHPSERFVIRTNNLGLRNDDDVLEEPVPLRVLVTGDSHVEGVVPYEETLTRVLESQLGEGLSVGSVEVLNAAMGGYNAYNYLGTLERFAYLDPDVFIVVLYGGNDFYRTVQMWRMFEGMGAPKAVNGIDNDSERVSDASWASTGQIRPQESNQARYFLAHPDDERLAIDATCSLLWQIQSRCEELSIECVVAYLPPPLVSQARLFAATREAVLGALDGGAEALDVSDRIADRVLGFLAERGVCRLDLRQRFAVEDRALFWRSDFHINTLGHHVAAEELFQIVSELPVTRALTPRTGNDIGAFDLAIPTAREQGWETTDEAVRFLPYECRPAVFLPGGEVTSRVRIGPDPRLTGARRVLIRAACDGEFLARVGIGGRMGDVIERPGTARRLAEFELLLPASNQGESAPVDPVLTIEVTAGSPVVVARVRIER